MAPGDTWLSAILTQHEITKFIAGYATTTDMVRLIWTCKTPRKHICNPDGELKDMYRKPTRYDGVGIRIRKVFHQPPPASTPHQPYKNVAKCKANDEHRKQLDCDTCGAITCDECRIYLVYQDTWATNDHWSHILGYILLDPELRSCWPPVANDRDMWEEDETHNDLNYGQSHETDIDMALRDYLTLFHVSTPLMATTMRSLLPVQTYVS